MHRVRFLPGGEEILVADGTILLDAALDHGVNVETLCGGRGICGKCRVRMTAEAPVYPAEKKLITADELARGYRLSCLHHVREDLEVEVIPAEDFAAKAFAGLGNWPPVALHPTVRRVRVRLPEPTLADNRADTRRIAEALGLGRISFTYGVLKELPEVVRKARFDVSVSLVDESVVDVERGHLRPPLGLAVDIGTTSVVGLLVNLKTGVASDVRAHSNSQARHGADVMARIDYALKEGGGETLMAEVVRDVNGIVDEALSATGAERRDILAVTVVGNTTMMHLFLGLSPRHMGVAPFPSVTNEPVVVQAKEIGLAVHPEAEVYVLPTVAAFVGADTVGGILATRLHEAQGTEILIDIGTNTEIVLAHRGRLYTASAPAGPAFEGAAIRHGMRATTGAIDTVRVEDGEIRYTTIGGAPALGICGTALVDLAAELVRVGLVDEGGRLHTLAELERRGASEEALLLARRVAEEEGNRSLLLVPEEASGTGLPITFTQADLRQYQLVKAAVATGIDVLLKEAGASPADIDAVYLAGTFGSKMNVRSALATGLVPDVPEERVHFVGNSALEGARMALLDHAFREVAAQVARSATHIELSARADFTERFVHNSSFPRPRIPTGGAAERSEAPPRRETP